LEVKIDDKELIKLIETGESRKLRLPAHVVEEFIAVLQELDAALTIYDIWQKHPKRKWEKLRGHGSRYSMRLTGKYRVEMEVTWTNIEKTIGVFFIDDVNNHYGD
jgi:plasmid maintenance system killer protein